MYVRSGIMLVNLIYCFDAPESNQVKYVCLQMGFEVQARPLWQGAALQQPDCSTL